MKSHTCRIDRWRNRKRVQVAANSFAKDMAFTRFLTDTTSNRIRQSIKEWKNIRTVLDTVATEVGDLIAVMTASNKRLKNKARLIKSCSRLPFSNPALQPAQLPRMHVLNNAKMDWRSFQLSRMDSIACPWNGALITGGSLLTPVRKKSIFYLTRAL